MKNEYPYEKWEDYLSGMYTISKVQNEIKLIEMSYELLSNAVNFHNVVCKISEVWPVCYDFNIRNKNLNRCAWIGAASCMINHNSPEYITRIAWNKINPYQQDIANRIAKQEILKYERQNTAVYEQVAQYGLF